MHRWFEARVAAGQWPPVSQEGQLFLSIDN